MPSGPKSRRPFFPAGWLPAWAAAFCCGLATAQPTDQAGALRPVVVTGGEGGDQRWAAPVAMEVVEGDDIRNGQLQVNLSESLGRVPGLVIQNRQNYAQDLQVSIRGFGARSTFGVRGLRLFVDGIPASAPDGQGQAAGFPLGNAQRIEVIRGPYSALYGASAGGVIALYTEDGSTPAQWRAGFAGGANGLQRFSTSASGRIGGVGEEGGKGGAGGVGYALNASSFSTAGLRPQSAADRDDAHLKLAYPYADGRVVLIADRQTGSALDPLGLSRAEFNANPYQTTATAFSFNTRKSVQQTQAGLAWEHRLGGGHRLELMAYGGQRALVQFQSIPTATQAAASSPGGVIGLDRNYGGLNARWRLDRAYGSGTLTASAGLAADRQSEQRRGFENFIGSAASPLALGVQGRLRRDETNVATSLDPYAQLEWNSRDWTVTAGVRHARVRLSSDDHYIAPGNPDDSGAVQYAATLPVLGLRYRLTPQVQAYASTGRGFETPTLNEVAYQASGATGLNTRLAASRSHSSEIGLRGRHGAAAWSATVFDIRTQDEIVVQANTGGRSTFQNAGRTRRRGLELSGEAQAGRLTVSTALTLMSAIYADGFLTCDTSPCATPNLAIPAGSRMPGIPARQAYVRLDWATGWAQSTVMLELRHSGAVPVNDRNSDSAAAYTVANLGVRWQQDDGPWQWREFVRVDNLTNRAYAGSVIVNEGNGRYFEAAPRRSAFVGIEVVRRFEGLGGR